MSEKLKQICEERINIKSEIPAGHVEYRFDEKQKMDLCEVERLTLHWGKAWNDSELTAKALLIAYEALERAYCGCNCEANQDTIAEIDKLFEGE